METAASSGTEGSPTNGGANAALRMAAEMNEDIKCDGDASAHTRPHMKIE